LRAEQTSALLRQTSAMMLANICNALTLIAALWNTRQHVPSLYWGAGLLLVAGFIRYRPRPASSKPRSDLAPRSSKTRRAVFNALALGLCWAAVPLFFFQDATPGARLLIACLSAGMLCGGAFALASIPPAAVAFSGPIIVAALAALAQSGDSEHVFIAIVLGVYSLVLFRGVFTHSAQLKAQVLTQLAAEKSVQTDSLTALPNRLAFQEAIEKEFERIARSDKRFALIFVDLDNFKDINDRFGHLAGDELLASAAKRMRAVVPSSDLVARLGGDEFAILAASAQEDAEITALAQRIIKCYEEPFLLDGHKVMSAASLGVAIAPKDGGDLRALQRNADIALYGAKKSVGSVRLFEPRHDAEAREARIMELDLLRAVKLAQLSLVFQPVLSIANGHIVGCEALTQWLHPVHGRVSPAVFIPIAEKIGFIHDLGLWVIESACRAAAHFPPEIRVAVNVSPIQLRDPAFPDQVLKRVAAAGVPPHRLEIEITESTLLSDDKTSHLSILKLAGAGISIALDDFGTGYSSLSYIRKIPLDKIKIDRSFVGDMLTQPDCAAIVLGVIRMAADLGISIVAEGVESLEQLEWLRQNGCSEAQGFLISKPASEEAFFDLLNHWPPKRLAA